LKLPQIAVGALVFRNGRVLLVKRKYNPAAGLWAIPGGRVQFGETLKDAAERELLEETSVQIKAGEPIYTFEYINSFHYVIIDLEAEYISGEPTPADDALDARWIRPDELAKLEVTSSTIQLLKRKNFIS